METGIVERQLTTKDLLNREDVQKRFKEMLGTKAQGFITSVLQIVASNEMLKDADPMSIYNASAVAATLDLPLNNNLGFAYIIPYKTNYTDNQGQPKTKVVAQFQMGYKGFIQLAQRSGQFKTISASPIYEGQLIEENPLTGFLFDFTAKKSDKIIGYASYFKLINGFEKVLYMPADTVVNHGRKFSKSFSKGFGLWKDDFDSMAIKTVLKLLLSKYAPLSIEMQKAVITDQAIINNAETEDVTYIDNIDEPKKELSQVDIEHNRKIAMLQSCKTLSELDQLCVNNPDFDPELIEARRKELTPISENKTETAKELQARLTINSKQHQYDDMSDEEKQSDKGLSLAHEIATLKGEVK